MLRNLGIILLASAMIGCASTATVKLDQDNSRRLQGKTLVVATSDKPDFAAMTAGKAMFAMLGAIAMISAGNEIIRQNDVEDPAVFIGSEVAREMALARGMNNLEIITPSEEDDIGYLTAEHAGHDYVLDIRTINWSFGYFPTDWNNYRVIYSAKSRLIDVKSREVVAEAFCSRIPEQTPSSPSYEQLLSNKAARLKDELQIAAEYCADELRSKML